MMVIGDTIDHGLNASRSYWVLLLLLLIDLASGSDSRSSSGGGSSSRSGGRQGGLSDSTSTNGDAGHIPTLDPLH